MSGITVSEGLLLAEGRGSELAREGTVSVATALADISPFASWLPPRVIDACQVLRCAKVCFWPKAVGVSLLAKAQCQWQLHWLTFRHSRAGFLPE
jgi:hypothetical protein